MFCREELKTLQHEFGRKYSDMIQLQLRDEKAESCFDVILRERLLLPLWVMPNQFLSQTSYEVSLHGRPITERNKIAGKGNRDTPCETRDVDGFLVFEDQPLLVDNDARDDSLPIRCGAIWAAVGENPKKGLDGRIEFNRTQEDLENCLLAGRGSDCTGPR